MIWPRQLAAEEVMEIANSCVCPKDFVVSFRHDQVERHGDVQFTIPSECPRLSPAVDDIPTNPAAIIVI